MKQTAFQRKQQERRRVYESVIRAMNLSKVIRKYGTEAVKMTLNRYLNTERARTRLLKEKGIAEARLREIDARL